MKIDQSEIRPGDVIRLGLDPAEVRDVSPREGGYVQVKIRRPMSALAPGALGTYYVGVPVELVERAATLV